MKDREFKKTLKELSHDNGKGILSTEKIAVLPNDKRNEVINYLVRKRLPIVKNFINNTTDMGWLASMGYMGIVRGKKFEFLCTCENKNQIS